MRTSVGISISVIGIIVLAVAVLWFFKEDNTDTPLSPAKTTEKENTSMPGTTTKQVDAVPQILPDPMKESRRPETETAAASAPSHIEVNGKRIPKKDVPEAALIYLETPEAESGGNTPTPQSFKRGPSIPAQNNDTEQTPSTTPASPTTFRRGSSSANPLSSPDSTDTPAISEAAPVEITSPTEDLTAATQENAATTATEWMESMGEKLEFQLIRSVSLNRLEQGADSVTMAMMVVPCLGSEETVPWLKKELLSSATKDPTLAYSALVMQALDRIDNAEGLEAIKQFASSLEQDPAYANNQDVIEQAHFLALSHEEEASVFQ